MLAKFPLKWMTLKPRRNTLDFRFLKVIESRGISLQCLCEQYRAEECFDMSTEIWKETDNMDQT
jgi:hypothetical protein